MKRSVRPYLLSLLKPYAWLCILLLSGTMAKSQVKAGFSASPAQGCAPLAVKFTDESTGSPVFWKWDLGNGAISFFQNPSAVYLNPGQYTIKLLVRNAANNADSVAKTSYVTVYAPPTINFTSNTTTGCYPLRVQFTDVSNPGTGNTIKKWEWDFGDGTTDSVANPSHTYVNLGNYNVSLRITNDKGCVSTISRTDYIKLNHGVHSDFKVQAPSSCRPPTTINFSNLSTGTDLLSYTWRFGDGATSTATNPSHVYNAAGTYSVTLVTRNSYGCIDSLVMPNAITIGSVDADFKAPDTACAGTYFNLINTSIPTPSNAYWNFGDGTTAEGVHAVKKYNTSGNYSIKLVSDFGACKDSITKKIYVLPKPATSFTADKTTSCRAPLTVTFTNSTAGASKLLWFFGDGDTSTAINPTHTYKETGAFDVSLVVTNANGCTDTLTKYEFIKIIPATVTITNLPTDGCAALQYRPEYRIESVDPVVSYFWDFGDGNTSSLANPVNIYKNPGKYTVKLVFTTAGGCKDSVVYPSQLQVGLKPTANFIATPRIACAFSPILFSDITTGAPVTRYLWEFGDGATSILPNPSHYYLDTGYFSVTLMVWNNGCRDSVTFRDYIHIRPPIAKFVDSSGCRDPFTVKFKDYSIGPMQWRWEFGDGGNSTESNPVHTYAAPGTYLVKLTVRNDTCEHTTINEIRVIKEKADFLASDTVICKHASVSFQTKNINAGNIAAYHWDFGDGVAQNGGAVILHKYTTSGIYSVRLIITDIRGCRDTLTKPMHIRVDGPTADFSSGTSGVCTNASVVFKDESFSDGLHTIEKYIWNYGDGLTDTLTGGPFQHPYNLIGSYQVQLKVIDNKGCIDSITKPGFILISKPAPGFISGDTLSCPAKPIRFLNYTNANGPSVYHWDFGDGSTSNQTSPTHHYATVGLYTVKLKATDRFGCIDSVTRQTYVSIKKPVAKMTLNDSVATCPPLVTTFTNESEYFQSYEWDFGDGTKSAHPNPVHFYNSPGVYYAKLVITSHGGCKDSVIKKIVVRGPQGDFIYDKFDGCRPTDINFTAVTKDNASFIWDFNDGSTDVTLDSAVTHTYDIIGTYVPTMILVDPAGCKVPIQGKDTIRIYGVESDFTFNKKTLCDSGFVSFNDLSVSNDLITGYKWDFGDGGHSNEKNPTHFYNSDGIFPIRLIITTALGCKDTTDLPAEIKIVKSPLISIRGTDAICVPANLAFEGQVLRADTSQVSWQWNFGNGQSAASQNPPSAQYNQHGNFVVTAIVQNSTGCADTASKPVIIHPLPVVDAGVNDTMCRFDTYTLHATGADKYTWAPSESLSCTDCATPLVRPDTNTMYYVAGETSFGCKGSDSVSIGVKQPFAMNVGAGDTLCIGQSFIMQAGGAERYAWTPTIGLDHPAQARVTATPTQTTTYRVIGTDTKGCFYDTGFVKVMVYPYPTVDAGPDQSMQVGYSLKLNPKLSADVNKITWQPLNGLDCANCATPTVSVKTTTTYKLTVANEGGCAVSDDVTVFVVCKEGNLYIPNTFSPNRDGNNESFYPQGRGIYSVKSFKVFNRWGELVFEKYNFKANNALDGWDGRHKGRDAGQDVYVYIVEILCENSTVLVFKGNVALLR